MWRKSAVGTAIENLAVQFHQTIELAIHAQAINHDSAASRDALLLAQGIIVEIAAEMRMQGTRDNPLQRDGLATLQAKHDATEMLLNAAR